MKTTDQIAAEAAEYIDDFYHKAYNGADKYLLSDANRDTRAIIKSAIEKAVKDEVWNHEQTAKLLRKKVEEFQKSRAAHASEPTYCKCDEINGDNPACPIHKTWTIETVGMIIGNVPVGDAAEAIAKAHNATHANEK